MEKTNSSLTKSLREQAEDILKSRLPMTGMPLSEAETLKLIRELQITQIELELQNQELLRNKRQNLISQNGANKILDLIDFEEVNKLLEGFNKSTGFVTAILDLEGHVLSKSGWRQICTEFHRINPQTSKNCSISDTVLANELGNGEKYHFYQCLNGLVDVAVPIVINGEHIANLFSGQFFFDEPDRSFFKKQASSHNFDEQKYLKALENVPIVSKEKVKVAMDFLLDMTQLISDITFQKLEQVQLNDALIKSEERSRNALDHMLEGCQIIGFDWKYIYLNHSAEVHNRRPNKELIGQRYQDMWPGIEKTGVFRIIKQVLDTRVSSHLENEFVFPDGSIGWFDLSIQPVPEGVFILSIDITERKRKEEQLYESEVRFSKLYEEGPFGMALVDASFGFKKVNPTYSAIMGYTEKELQNMTFEDITHPDDRSIDRPNVLKLIRKETTSYKTEKRYIRKDGQTIWGSLTVTANYSDDGSFLYNLAIVEDITRRKLAEDEIKRLNERISTATHASQVGIWEWDVQNDVLMWDDQMYALYGLKKEEFTGAYTAWINGLHPNDREFCQNEVNSALLGKKEYDIEFRVVWPDGTIHYQKAKGEVFRNEMGAPVRMIGINYDITEQKKADVSLKESEDYFRNIFEYSTVGKSITESNGKLRTNKMFRDITGYSGGELVELSWQKITHPDDIRNDQEMINSIISGEFTSRRWEKRYIHKQGHIVWVDISTLLQRDTEGNPKYFITTIQDITQRKKVQESLRTSEEKLRAIYNVLPFGISLIENNRSIAQMNPVLEKIIKLSHSEVTEGKHKLRKYLRGDGSEMPLSEMASARAIEENKVIQDVETGIQTEDGSVFWTSVSAAPLNVEGLSAVVITQDINARKHAEEALKISEARFRNLFESAVIGIYRTTPDGKILMANPTLIKMLGFGSFEELAMRNLKEEGFETKSLRDDFRNRIEENGSLTAYESVWKTANGSSVYVSENAKAIYNSTGQVMYYEGTIEDITERKRVERALRESEEIYRKAFKTSPDSVNINRLEDGMYISVNRGFLEIMEYTEAEVIGKKSLEINIWKNPEDRKLLVKELKSKGFVSNLEAKFCTKSGKEIDGLMSAAIIEIDGGTHIINITRDITIRKQIEQALRYNEALLQEVGRIAHVGGWDFDPATGLSTCTEEVARIHDLDPKTPASVVLSINYYTEQSRPVIEKAFREAAELAKPYDLELEIITAQKNHKWIRTIGRPIVVDGKVVKLQGSMQDITKRKLAEQALRESEEKFRGLLESMPLPVTYVSNSGEIIFRNNRFLEVIGYNSEDVPTVEKWWLCAYPEEHYRNWAIQQWSGVVQRASQQGADIESEEYRITCKDGLERIFIVSGIIIEDNLLITFIDITDRKKAEEQVIKLNETLEQRVEDRTAQLKEANQELEAFSYSVSHDLRAPLRHINGFVDLLVDKYQESLPDKAQHYLKTIVDSSRQMGQLIDDLLEFSRTGRKEILQVKLNLNAMVEKSLELLAKDTEGRNIKWEISSLPLITGDHALLQQVWVNLLSNAIKFTKAKEQAIIKVGYKKELKEHVFFVRDNGAGFDMKYVHKLFGVFQRLHSKTEFEGTGIGLANVRRIILKHGGRIWAESQINQGATFYFTIPNTKI